MPMKIDNPYIAKWLEHIRVLADEIGPRGSTTEAERRGSDYCEKELADRGYTPRQETFPSARSIYTPHLLASTAMLFAFALYPVSGRITAAAAFAITILFIVSELFELALRDNLLRRILPKGTSQNVIAILPPEGEHCRDLILIGHVDSHRMPIIFSSKGWLRFYKTFTSIAFVFYGSQAILYGIGTSTQWSWIWFFTFPSALCAIGLAALCVHADRTPFSPGANDNATAAGLVLTLAEHLRAEPLESTRVWLVCTGAEEVQHYGATDFFRRHRKEMKDPRALVFEMLGCAGPAWLTREGIVVTFQPDSDMLSLVENLAADHPEWKAHPAALSGGNTEMADALLAGVPSITFIGSTTDGHAPYWHQREDKVDKMDADVMSRAYDMIWTYIRAIDYGALPDR